MNIADVKKQLQSLGLSIATPGLTGQDRLDELSYRLEQHKSQLIENRAVNMVDTKISGKQSDDNLSHISINELKIRLNALGESAVTTGLVGEERRLELLRRLTNAVCGTGDSSDDEPKVAKKRIDDDISPPPRARSVLQTAKIVPIHPPYIPTYTPPIIEAPVAIIQLSKPPVEEDSAPSLNTVDLEEPVSSDSNPVPLVNISELKNELKRLLNKRELFIAYKLSGSTQDISLKESEGVLTRVDLELNMFNGIIQKGELVLPVHAVKSQFLQQFVSITSPNSNIHLEKYVTHLNKLKDDYKGKIREHRLRIREVAETSEEFGLAEEESLRNRLSEANLTQMKSKQLKQQKSATAKATIATPSSSLKSNSNSAVATGTVTKVKEGERSNETTTAPRPDRAEMVQGATSSRALSTMPAKAIQVTSRPEISPSKTVNYIHNDLDATVSSRSGETNKPTSKLRQRFHDIKDSSSKSDLDSSTLQSISADSTLKPGEQNIATEFRSAFLEKLKQTEVEKDKKGRKPPKLPIEDVVGQVVGSNTRFEVSFEENNGLLLGNSKSPITGNMAVYDSFHDSSDNVGVAEVTAPPRISTSKGDAVPISKTGGRYNYRQESASSSEEEEDDDDDEEDDDDDNSDRGRNPHRDSVIAAPPPNKIRVQMKIDSIMGKATAPSKLIESPVKPSNSPLAATLPSPSSSPPGPKHLNGENSSFPLSKFSPGPSHSARDEPAPIRHVNDTEEDFIDERDSDGDYDHTDANGEISAQIRILRSNAKDLISSDDFAAAEALYEEILDLDPTNITSLADYAKFLHTKRGELVRAEAFFNRGLQVCLPDLDLKSSPSSKVKSVALIADKFSSPIVDENGKMMIPARSIVLFLMNYAHFCLKAKADVEAAHVLFDKALEIDPENPALLSNYGYFHLTYYQSAKDREGKPDLSVALQLFEKSLKADPTNVQCMLWYAKGLKRCRRFGQAELMYRVAVDKARGLSKMEPVAICNYGIFLYNQRKDAERAVELLQDGLLSYPGHRGLVKNYAHMTGAKNGKGPLMIKN